MSDLLTDYVKPRDFRNARPGSVQDLRVVPGTLHVVMLGIQTNARNYDSVCEEATRSLKGGRAAALALTMGPDRGEPISRPVEARLVSEPDVLNWILHAKNINDARKRLAGTEANLLQQDTNYTAGRNETNGIVIPPTAKLVSRRHLTFTGYPDRITRRMARDYWLGSLVQGSLTASPNQPAIPNTNGSIIISREFDSYVPI